MYVCMYVCMWKTRRHVFSYTLNFLEFRYVGAAIAASKSYVPVIGILSYAVVNNKKALDIYPKV